MKTINASKPAANPQQFTKVPSNPLLISAQKQMLQAEEIKKAKELAAKKRSQDESLASMASDPANTANPANNSDEPGKNFYLPLLQTSLTVIEICSWNVCHET